MTKYPIPTDKPDQEPENSTTAKKRRIVLSKGNLFLQAQVDGEKKTWKTISCHSRSLSSLALALSDNELATTFDKGQAIISDLLSELSLPVKLSDNLRVRRRNNLEIVLERKRITTGKGEIKWNILAYVGRIEELGRPLNELIVSGLNVIDGPIEKQLAGLNVGYTVLLNDLKLLLEEDE